MNDKPGKGRARTTGRIETLSEEEFEKVMWTRSRRSFLVGGIAALAGIGSWTWLTTRDPEGGTHWPLRRALDLNERLARGCFSDDHLAETYPETQSVMPRVNGGEGLPDGFDPSAWKLRVAGLENEEMLFTMDDIRSLPKIDMVTQLRCIEGWSAVVHWGGVRFSDFVTNILRGSMDIREQHPYVGLSTPDGGYFVGLDTASAMHPQTLLCYEMAGRPLTPAHGAPLRLVIPVKYGVKNIKRIGTIRFSDDRPLDYWGERGYDWYAGL